MADQYSIGFKDKKDVFRDAFENFEKVLSSDGRLVSAYSYLTKTFPAGYSRQSLSHFMRWVETSIAAGVNDLWP
jgi:hypothetical protein